MPEPESVKERILLFVERNPGMHFREIQRQTGTAVGQLEYHLYTLENEGEIKGEKDGKFVRYFALSGGSFQKNLFYFVRNNKKREIVFDLIKGDIAEGDLYPRNEKKRIQTLFVLGELESVGIVSRRENDDQIFYTIKNREKVIEMLVKFRESFLDYASNNFLNLFR